jgi:hypothetical protein
MLNVDSVELIKNIAPMDGFSTGLFENPTRSRPKHPHIVIPDNVSERMPGCRSKPPQGFKKLGMSGDNSLDRSTDGSLRHEMCMNAVRVDLQKIENVSIQNQFDITVLKLALRIVSQELRPLPVIEKVFENVLRAIGEDAALPEMKITDDDLKLFSWHQGELLSSSDTAERPAGAPSMRRPRVSTQFRVRRFAW